MLGAGDRLRVSAGMFLGLAALASLGLIVLAILNNPPARYAIGVATGVTEKLEAPSDSFFSERVQPVFDRHCVSCHRDGKAKGHLKLEAFHQPFLGGREGPSILPGDAEASPLLARMRLPPANPMAMPPLGKSRPSAGDLTALEMWIDDGADGSATLASLPDAPTLARVIEIPRFDPDAVAKARGEIAKKVASVADLYPGLLYYSARDSVHLTLSANAVGQEFDDALFADLSDLLPYIEYADLAGAPITERSIPLIERLAKAKALRLERSGLTSLSDESLGELSALETVSLSGGLMSTAELTRLRASDVAVFVVREGGER